jgi:hypothetical protein
LPLSDDGFIPKFKDLWAAHIDFGTSRSHKKLLGKKLRDEAQAFKASLMPDEKGSKKQRRLKDAGMAGGARHNLQPMLQVSDAVQPPLPIQVGGPESLTISTLPLANKGRFAGTLAARLLGGGV